MQIEIVRRLIVGSVAAAARDHIQEVACSRITSHACNSRHETAVVGRPTLSAGLLYILLVQGAQQK